MSNRIVMLRTRDLINQIPKLAKWGIPLVIGGIFIEITIYNFFRLCTSFITIDKTT